MRGCDIQFGHAALGIEYRFNLASGIVDIRVLQFKGFRSSGPRFSVSMHFDTYFGLSTNALAPEVLSSFITMVTFARRS